MSKLLVLVWREKFLFKRKNLRDNQVQGGAAICLNLLVNDERKTGQKTHCGRKETVSASWKTSSNQGLLNINTREVKKGVGELLSGSWEVTQLCEPIAA